MRGSTFRDLRLSDGKIDILRALAYGRQPSTAHRNSIDALLRQGLILMIDGRLQLTDAGRPYADEIARLYEAARPV
jgi:hypothetical protein